MATPFDTAKNAILGVPADPNKKPSRVGIVQAFAEMQTQLDASASGALVKSTLAALTATTTAPSVGCMAWVVKDATAANNGIYENTGTASAAVWTRRTDLPVGFISGVNAGAGTADALQITTDLPVPMRDGGALISVPVIGVNTVSPPTVSFNGGAALPIVTASGVNAIVGGISTGMILLGCVSSGKFRMFNDTVSSDTVTNLAAQVALKAPLASPALTGTPTAPTPAVSTNTTQLATTAFVKAALDALVAAAPGTLDTLNELATALGNDPNFAATMTTALASKLPSSSYTAIDVLAKVKTVDGTNSGLDADLVRGVMPSAFGLSVLDDADAVAARTTLGLSAVASSGSASDLASGTVPDARLPTRLGEFARFPDGDDWNNAVSSGFWMTTATGLNLPEAGMWALGFVVAHNNLWVTQTAHAFAADGSGDTRTYRRELNNGAWGSWYRIRQSEAELDARYGLLTNLLTTLSGGIDPANDQVALYDASAGAMVKVSISSLVSAATAGVSTFNGRSGTVTLQESDLPDRLNTNQIITVDVNAAINRGLYLYLPGATNTPEGAGAATGYGFVVHTGDGFNGYQYANRLDDTTLWRRKLSGGSWQSWERVRETEAELDARYAPLSSPVFTGGQSLPASGGFKFIRCINLAGGTDLNTITDAGFYDVSIPTNGPWSGIDWGYLEVLRHSTDAGWCVQRYTTFFGSGEVCWQRRQQGGAWLAWKPVSGFATPAHFGADGASTPAAASTNDAAALQRWLDSGLPLYLDQWYRCDATALAHSIASEGGFAIHGRGSASGIKLTGGSTISITNGDLDNPTGTLSKSVTFRDFDIMIDQATTVDIMTVSFADGDMGSSICNWHMQNVHFKTSSNTNGTTGAILKRVNVRNGLTIGCSFHGKYFEWTGTGILDQPGVSSAPVENLHIGINMYHLGTGHKIVASAGAVQYDDPQGYGWEECNFLAVDRGWDINGGPEGFGEWWKWRGCHASMRECGIIGNKIGNTHITDCYFLGQNGRTDCQGIVLANASLFGTPQWITNNCVDFRGVTSTNRIGLNLASQPVVRSGNVIYNATGNLLGNAVSTV